MPLPKSPRRKLLEQLGELQKKPKKNATQIAQIKEALKRFK